VTILALHWPAGEYLRGETLMIENQRLHT